MFLLSRLLVITLSLVLVASGWAETEENREESILELEKNSYYRYPYSPFIKGCSGEHHGHH